MKSAEPDRECMIAKGLHQVRDGSSIKRASRSVGIPRSTLRDRLQGRQPIQKAKAKTQRLSPKQEKLLVDRILAEEEAGRPLSKTQVQAFAQRVVVANNGDDHAIGMNWVDRFIRRHEEIKTKIQSTQPVGRKAVSF